jgi:hypothetical protein
MSYDVHARVQDLEQQIRDARHSVRSLATVDGEECTSLVKVLEAKRLLLEASLDGIAYHATLNAAAKRVQQEAEHVRPQLTEAITTLRERAAYKGLRRSQMTDGEKSAYITQHGGERYLALPE